MDGWRTPIFKYIGIGTLSLCWGDNSTKIWVTVPWGFIGYPLGSILAPLRSLVYESYQWLLTEYF